ncbi:probable G-protein coupled receptor Mth-like 10 [Camponotus floridanus]|uniref:probable G-protein coupled receptor Mth-like 10 n=1 Tax=Camponotus floridanus TaxID=104421 RepID=UPI000DC679CC|nr:probable G-protein coupled receptor Mth-like 10 [Camponotus floridanus]XP_025264560.1 probable G-protein coupled receptor Mth-like 10 [Camponotus floridanus]
MMYGKDLIFYCMLPIIASSSTLWSNLTGDNKEKDYSTTIRYQLDTNNMKNYDDGEDWYNLHENFTKNNDDMEYRINFTNNNHERLMIDDFTQYKSRAHENDSQISVNSRNSTEFDSRRNFISQELNDLKRIKGNNDLSTYDSFNNFNRSNREINIIPYKMCDNITCIQLCCPFGNRLINGKCIPEQGYFVFLRNMYGYINDSFQTKSEKVDDAFLLVVHDPCQKTGHYLMNPYLIQNKFLINGSLYLPDYNTIVEPTSYCLAVVNYNIFAVNVCFEIMKKIISKTTNNNKDIIYPINTNENLEHIKNEYMSHEYFKNSNTVNNKSNIIPYKMCDNITCIRLCCPFGSRLVKRKCIAQQGNFIFLEKMFGYINDSSRNENKKINELFLLIVHNPCQKTGYHWFNPYNTFFLANGSLYLSHYNTIIESTSYCLANIAQDKFIVNVCSDIMKKITNETIRHKGKNVFFPISSIMIVFSCGQLGVILSSLMMFIVYSIQPELQNIHGFILCRYSGLIFVAYTIFLMDTLIEKDALGDYIYIIFAVVKYHAFFGSYLWLNVMSFNIWRTFRQLHSSQRMMKQEEKKMLIIYSIYAWGVPFIIIYILLLFILFFPLIQNNFGLVGRLAYWLYYYGIIISVTSNICLSFFTARKIAYLKQNDAYHLRNSEKKHYDDQKQWFKLQLEVTKVLFIIMCVKTYINVEELYNNDNNNDNDTLSGTRLFVLDVIQYFYVFIIFVWKKKSLGSYSSSD